MRLTKFNPETGEYEHIKKAKTLAEYRAQRKAVIQRLGEYEDKTTWLSVDEWLPENIYGKNRKKITVLVCTESGKISTATRQKVIKWDKTKLEWVELDEFEWSKGKRVTHWMPLPEPPKMKGAEDRRTRYDYIGAS